MEGRATDAILVADDDPLTFASVSAAVAHATTLQPGARVGVAAGSEPDAPAVAHRLRAAAEPGQVLVSDPVRWAEHDGHAFRDAGSLAGDAPLRAWELLWAEPAPRTRARLFGHLSVAIDGEELEPPRGQAASLLGYLLANPERVADRAELIDVLWPHRAPRDPQAALRPILSRLRRALAPAALNGRERIHLQLPEPVWTDIGEALAALTSARTAAKSEDWATTRAHAEAALNLLQPGFLPGIDDEWAHARRLETEELELEALEWIARASLGLEKPELGPAQRAARELVARSPFRETGHRFLMEALARAGNVAEAMRVYDDLRVLLRDELGTAPAAELQALHQRLLAGEGARPEIADEPPAAALPRQLAPREASIFVARRRELDMLRAAWDQTRAGSRRLVFVGGEPGIGKTRLAQEFAHAAHADGTVLYAACPEEALVAYQPFLEALRNAGLDWARVARMPGASELARLIPELPAHPGAPAGDAELRRYLLFEAMSSLLDEVAAQAPLALVVDDLHWADRGTLDLLRHVARSRREAPLLIIGTYRDAELRPVHPLAQLLADLRRDPLVERVALQGLTVRDVGALIDSHAGHPAPPSLVGTVHEHTDGNPFFVEEVLRHLIETGVLYERGGRWTSALTPDEIGVPEGVQEVLERRLSRLSDSCRTVLAAAAVLGREFSFDVLQAMVDTQEDALIAALEEALDAQLIVDRDHDDVPGYGFTHALVRQTLYMGTSGPRRRRLHAQAAAAIELTHSEEHVAALARHHRLAGSSGDPTKAIRCSLAAGEHAAARFAWNDAAEHWDGAAAVMARVGGWKHERAKLLIALGDLMVVVGDLGRQLAYLEQALALYDQLGDDERAAQAHSRLGMAHSLMDSIYADHLDIPTAFRHFDAARTVLDRGPPRRAGGHLEVGIATALTYSLRIEPGLDAARRAMEIADAVGDELLWSGAAEAYAWHALVAGRLGDGFAVLERAFDVADRNQRPFLAFMAANIHGQFTWGLGAPSEAQAHFERPLHRLYAGDGAYRRQIADGIGRCHAARGEIVEARHRLPDATPTWITHSLKPILDLWDADLAAVDALAAHTIETSRRTGNRWDAWAARQLSARVCMLRGDHPRAVELLDAALGIVVDGGAPYFELWVRPDLSRALVECRRIDQAREHVDRCRTILQSGEDWRGRAGMAAVAEGIVLAHEGRAADAEQVFTDARAVLAAHDLAGDEADLLHQWGRVLAAPDRLHEAAELYRRHGAGSLWLERIASDSPRQAEITGGRSSRINRALGDDHAG
jgi:DNA-binding SARP family transcriptional activator/tetratricopeptide (TPR) repeat protein